MLGEQRGSAKSKRLKLKLFPGSYRSKQRVAKRDDVRSHLRRLRGISPPPARTGRISQDRSNISSSVIPATVAVQLLANRRNETPGGATPADRPRKPVVSRWASVAVEDEEADAVPPAGGRETTDGTEKSIIDSSRRPRDLRRVAMPKARRRETRGRRGTRPLLPGALPATIRPPVVRALELPELKRAGILRPRRLRKCSPSTEGCRG